MKKKKNDEVVTSEIVEEKVVSEEHKHKSKKQATSWDSDSVKRHVGKSTKKWTPNAKCSLELIRDIIESENEV